MTVTFCIHYFLIINFLGSEPGQSYNLYIA